MPFTVRVVHILHIPVTRQKVEKRNRHEETPVLRLFSITAERIITSGKRALIGGAHRTRNMSSPGSVRTQRFSFFFFYVLLTRMSRFELRVYQQHKLSSLSE